MKNKFLTNIYRNDHIPYWQLTLVYVYHSLLEATLDLEALGF